MTSSLPAVREHQEIDLDDPSSPRALINLVPEAVREVIERVPDTLRAKTPVELEKMTPKGEFTLVDRRLRTAFWLEYERAQSLGRQMTMSNVYGGICSKAHFYIVLQDPIRVAHLLLAPLHYQVAMEEALTFGVDRLREILQLPMFRKNGTPDTAVAEVIRKTVEMLDQRVKGAVVQRIEQKNLNLNVGASPRESPPSQDMAEIDRKLKALEEDVEGAREKLPRDLVIDSISITQNEGNRSENLSSDVDQEDLDD